MRRFNDPIELIVADALDAAGISYTHESEAKDQRLDFALEGGLMIECKQFPTSRTSEQIAPFGNVIVIQGRQAADWFASMVRGCP